MIASRYLSTFDNPVGQRMARLMVGEVTRSREIVEIFGNAVIKRVLGFLKSYMARHIEFGGLRVRTTPGPAHAHS